MRCAYLERYDDAPVGRVGHQQAQRVQAGAQRAVVVLVVSQVAQQRADGAGAAAGGSEKGAVQRLQEDGKGASSQWQASAPQSTACAPGLCNRRPCKLAVQRQQNSHCSKHHTTSRMPTWTPPPPPPARSLCAPLPPAPAWLRQCTRRGWWTRPAGN